MSTIRHKFIQFIVVTSVFSIVTPLIALADSDHEQIHQHGAHVHGAAILNWVMEGKTLQVSLQSPAMNMVGFEHRPDSDDEHQHVALMLENLNNTEKVVQLMGGQCELLSTKIINPFEGVSDEVMHAEITATYQFLCQAPSQLKTMTIELFDTFSRFERIDSQWIVDGKQGGATLNHQSHILKVH